MREITMNDLCDKLNNYFERDICTGTFTVENGSISLPFLLDGQYFRIVNSPLNDGVYRYPCSGLNDENFDGEIWAMAVPPVLVALLDRINKWEEKYGEAASAPYQSESFAGYSYSKGNQATKWQTAFSGELSRWRKI